MKRVSNKQSVINRTLTEKKKALGNRCCICHRLTSAPTLMHLLPRSLYPEYQTEDWNLAIGCLECHDKYDNNLEFRQTRRDIYEKIKEHDPLAAARYFRIYE